MGNCCSWRKIDKIPYESVKLDIELDDDEVKALRVKLKISVKNIEREIKVSDDNISRAVRNEDQRESLADLVKWKKTVQSCLRDAKSLLFELEKVINNLDQAYIRIDTSELIDKCNLFLNDISDITFKISQNRLILDYLDFDNEQIEQEVNKLLESYTKEQEITRRPQQKKRSVQESVTIYI